MDMRNVVYIYSYFHIGNRHFSQIIILWRPPTRNKGLLYNVQIGHIVKKCEYIAMTFGA